MTQVVTEMPVAIRGSSRGALAFPSERVHKGAYLVFKYRRLKLKRKAIFKYGRLLTSASGPRVGLSVPVLVLCWPQSQCGRTKIRSQTTRG